MLAVAGSITVGDIQAFIQYVRSFTQPITQIAQVFNMLQSMAAAAERIFEFLDEEEEPVTENPVRLEDIKGEVEFEHVRFGYDPQKPVIHDFTCHVEPGSMVAIVAADLTVTGVTAAELAPAAEAFAALPLCCITEDNNFINSYCRVVYPPFILLYSMASNQAFQCPTKLHSATVAITGFARGTMIRIQI